MSDNRGRGPVTNEGRIEKSPSRPYENKPGSSTQVKEQQEKTKNAVKGVLNKK